MTTIHYLQWDSPDDAVRERAGDLFHRFHHDPPESLAADDIEELYAEVATVETTDLEQLFAEWNRGSGYESDRFQQMRYCDRCDGYIAGHDAAVTHAARNHGYAPAQPDDAPAYVRGIRSLSVGDVAAQGDRYYGCAPVGWQDLDLVGGGD